jgi:hypothetical protein
MELTRRGFLSALAAMPLVGKFVPKPEPMADEWDRRELEHVYQTMWPREMHRTVSIRKPRDWQA